MAKHRREPVGDGPGFSKAGVSRPSWKKEAPRASRKGRRVPTRPDAHESDTHEYEKSTAERLVAEVAPTHVDTRTLAPLHPNFRAPEPGTSETSSDVQPVRPLSRDVWVTKDGRELTIKEMFRPHLGNAQVVISKWLKAEKDPVKRRELKSWRSKMRRELVKREKAWQAKRKKQFREQS